MRKHAIWAAGFALLALTAACSEQSSPLGPMGVTPFGSDQLEPASHEGGTVDFEGATPGDLNPSFTEAGITIVTSAVGDGRCPDESTVYDTNGTAGPDTDLEQQEVGNVLIIQDTDLTGGQLASDCEVGGVLTVEFSSEVTLHSIEVLDTEHTAATAGDQIELFGPGDVLLATFTLPQTGDGGIATVDLGDTEGVVKLVLTYRATCPLCASIAINDIVFSLSHNGGTEGCTPGFFKNNTPASLQHLLDDNFEATFGITSSLSDTLTIEGALNLGGGGLNALARHAAAAFLNASGDVDFEFSTAEVIAIVQDGVNPGGRTVEEAKNELATQNELGCPLQGNPGSGNNGNGPTSNGNGRGRG